MWTHRWSWRYLAARSPRSLKSRSSEKRQCFHSLSVRELLKAGSWTPEPVFVGPVTSVSLQRATKQTELYRLKSHCQSQYRTDTSHSLLIWRLTSPNTENFFCKSEITNTFFSEPTLIIKNQLDWQHRTDQNALVVKIQIWVSKFRITSDGK